MVVTFFAYGIIFGSVSRWRELGKEICGIGFQTSFSLPHKKAGLGKQKNVLNFLWKWGGGGVISQKNILNRGVFSERANLIQTGISCVFVPW